MLKKLIQAFVPALSPADFTREAEFYLENLGNGWEARVVEPLHIEITRSAGDEPVQMHLDNAYRNYLGNRSARRQIIAQYVDALLSADDKLLPKDIIPIVKDKAFVTETLEHLKGQGKDGTDLFTTEEYNEELVIVYAIDSAQSIRYLNPGALNEIDLQGESLRSLAISNLKRILPGIEVHGKPPFLMLTAGGVFESSLLLLERVWDKRQLGIEGDIVIAVPSRDVLLVADGNSEAALQKLRKQAAQIAGSAAYRLSDRLFVWTGTSFAVFK